MMTALSPTRAEEVVLCGRCQEREATKKLPVPGSAAVIEYGYKIEPLISPQEASYCDACASIRAEEVTAAREWRGFCRSAERSFERYYPALVNRPGGRRWYRSWEVCRVPRPLLTAPQDTIRAYYSREFWRYMKDAAEARRDRQRVITPNSFKNAPGLHRQYITIARRHRIEAAQRKVA